MSHISHLKRCMKWLFKAFLQKVNPPSVHFLVKHTYEKVQLIKGKKKGAIQFGSFLMYLFLSWKAFSPLNHPAPRIRSCPDWIPLIRLKRRASA